jgi:hypothetical protein
MADLISVLLKAALKQNRYSASNMEKDEGIVASTVFGPRPWWQ